MSRSKWNIPLLALMAIHICPVVSEVNYKGFNTCGRDGWLCNNNGSNLEVIYECPKFDKKARVWVWTARIPQKSTVFTVQNCDEVQVHFDCTTGTRSHTLHTFRLINITYVQALRPMKPRLFLHDNDMFHQMPPEFYVKNVEEFNLAGAKTLFTAPPRTSMCRPVEFLSLKLENVTNFLDSAVDFDASLTTTTELLKINLTAIQRMTAISKGTTPKLNLWAKEVYISDLSMPSVRTYTINITANKVTFTGNRFLQLQSESIKVQSQDFIFKKNDVSRVEGRGLNVVALRVQLTENNFANISANAFSFIKPGLRAIHYTVPGRFLYNFSSNIIQYQQQDSIQPNEAYRHACSDLILDNNYLPCTCGNNSWLPELQRYNWSQSFYGMLTKFGSNKCLIGNNNSQITCLLKNNFECENFTKLLETHCDSEVQASDVTQDGLYWVSEINFLPSTVVDDVENASMSYSGEQIVGTGVSHGVVTGVVCTLIIVIVIGAVLAYVWYYKSKKSVQSNESTRYDRTVLMEEHEI